MLPTGFLRSCWHRLTQRRDQRPGNSNRRWRHRGFLAAAKAGHGQVAFETLEERTLLTVIPGFYGTGMVTSTGDVYRLDASATGLTPYHVGKLMLGTNPALPARDDAVLPGYPGGEFLCVADNASDSSGLGLPSMLRRTAIDVFNVDVPTTQLAVTNLGTLRTPSLPVFGVLDVRLNALEWSPGLGGQTPVLLGAGYAGKTGFAAIRNDAVFTVNPDTLEATPILDLDSLNAESAGDIAFDLGGQAYLSLTGGKLLQINPQTLATTIHTLTPGGLNFDALLPYTSGTLIGITAERNYYVIDLTANTTTLVGTLTSSNPQWLKSGESVYGTTVGYQAPTDVGTIDGVVTRTNPALLGQRWYELSVQNSGTLTVDLTAGSTAGSWLMLYRSTDAPPAAQGHLRVSTPVTAGDHLWLYAVDLQFQANATFQFDNRATDTTAPTANIVAVTPDPRNTNAGVVTVAFSEPVTGVDVGDFRLTRNGTSVSLAGLTVGGSGASYQLDLSTKTVAEGAYLLTLTAAGSGIQDAAGNPLTGDALDAWVMDTTPPGIAITTPIMGDGQVNLAEVGAVLVAGTGADASRSVTVTFTDAGALHTASRTLTTDEAGNWTLGDGTTADLAALTDGPVTVTASSTDLAGNRGTAEATINKDVVPPAVSVTRWTTNDATPVVTGTLGDGVLQIVVNGKTYTVGDGNLTVTNTLWALEIPATESLSAGTYDVSATAMDVAGNVGSDTTTNELRIQFGEDTDGVVDTIEAGAPNGGDGNHDGQADSQQSNVASFPSAETGEYLTLAAPDGLDLVDVRIAPNPSPNDTPQTAQFAIGFVEFVVANVGQTEPTIVTLYVEPGTVLNTYYKYGPTPDRQSPHWYPFMFDGTTGAILFADRIELHFMDGQRGDDDLQQNGRITDIGAPGFTAHPWQNPAVQCDVDNDGDVVPLDALLLISVINTGGNRNLPAVPQGLGQLPPYLDVSGDDLLAPVDVLMVIHYINSHPRGSGEGEAVAHTDSPPVLDAVPALNVPTTALLAMAPVQQAAAAPNDSYSRSPTYPPLVPTAPAAGEIRRASLGTGIAERELLVGRATQTPMPTDLDRLLTGWDALLSDIAEDVFHGWEPDVGTA